MERKEVQANKGKGVLKTTKTERQGKYDRRHPRRNRSLCRKTQNKKKNSNKTPKGGGGIFFFAKIKGGEGKWKAKKVTGITAKEEQQSFLKERQG